jgi:hypothetical protein
LTVQPFLSALTGEGWQEVKDGNDTVRAIFDRHYSRQHYRDGRRPKLFLGPGQKMVLMTADAGAICAWRKFITRGKPQEGVNCAIYRRETGEVASELLRRAMDVAWQRWAGERLYTYVDPLHVEPTWRAGRPTWGHCFYQAGWRFCGLTAMRLHILECRPEWVLYPNPDIPPLADTEKRAE